MFAAHDRNKGGSQCNLGFAKTNVAADQSVHGFTRGHVLDDRVDCRGLIGSLFESEGLGKRVIVVRRVLERMTLPAGAACVQVQQLGRRIAYLLGGLALGLVPLT